MAQFELQLALDHSHLDIGLRDQLILNLDIVLATVSPASYVSQLQIYLPNRVFGFIMQRVQSDQDHQSLVLKDLDVVDWSDHMGEFLVAPYHVFGILEGQLGLFEDTFFST